jgi:hypothetical protein
MLVFSQNLFNLGTKVSEIQSVEEASIKKAVAFCENRTFKISNYLD